MTHERIPREKDPAKLARMIDWSASRSHSSDDVWHMLAESRCQATWQGIPILKNAFDLRRYFDVIADYAPEVIVETGVQHGGSALFFADVALTLGRKTPYVGVDLDFGMFDARVVELLDAWEQPYALVRRDCLALETVETVSKFVAGARRALFVLDSVHTKEHVDEELRLYAPLVPVGGYLVVEDTDHNGRPVLLNYGPAAGEAVDEFLASPRGAGFVRAREIEHRYGSYTNAPGGWLRRSRA